MKNNIAKVIYRNTVDGKIEIIRLEGFLTLDEINNKFGSEVARIYDENGTNRFYRYRCNYNIALFFGGCSYDLSTKILSKDAFEKIIARLKYCGNRLGDIRKQVAHEAFTKERVIEI